MTQPRRQLFPLWDHGWLDHNSFRLIACRDPQEIIEAYLGSDSFGSSFVGPTYTEAVAPELHGPFWRSLVNVNDFQLISPDEFQEQVQKVRQPTGFSEGVNDEQWQPINDLIARLKLQYQWIINLRLTEQNVEKFHDWGLVLTIFREYLLANPNSEQVSILIFGYD